MPTDDAPDDEPPAVGKADAPDVEPPAVGKADAPDDEPPAVATDDAPDDKPPAVVPADAPDDEPPAVATDAAPKFDSLPKNTKAQIDGIVLEWQRRVNKEDEERRLVKEGKNKMTTVIDADNDLADMEKLD